ncbi:DNA damage-inducible protein 1 [Coemansia sp. RSA 988]|nr:DNA damage-inducible protein 1 [Coemansia sp. RSA 988]
MRLTIIHDKASFTIEVDESMELGDLCALLELECSIPVDNQQLLYNGMQLNGSKKSLSSLGVTTDSALYIHDKTKQQQIPPPVPQRSANNRPVQTSSGHDAQLEAYRQQVLSNPQLMRELSRTHPEVAEAARNDAVEFGRLLTQLREQQQETSRQQQIEMERLNADPFNIEAQQKIEEMIRQENVMRNMEAALEHNPESFASVTMLYIDVIVNGVPIKAMVDSGAQSTVMSYSCAEKCGIMRLIDKRFAGEARGVGRAKILGRVHNAQMKVGLQVLMCSFSVMEGAHIDLLFGLDMLKRHQMCIDLKQNTLVIGEENIQFLPEHMIPKEQHEQLVPPMAADPLATPSSSALSETEAQTSDITVTTTQPQQQLPLPSGGSYAEDIIKAVMDLGVNREQAIHYLNAAGGNPDIAASMIFS